MLYCQLGLTLASQLVCKTHAKSNAGSPPGRVRGSFRSISLLHYAPCCHEGFSPEMLIPSCTKLLRSVAPPTADFSFLILISIPGR